MPVPRADGDREALRILLGARHDLTTSSTAQTNRLRALLRSGQDTEAELARGPLSEAVLTALARRRLPRNADRQQAVRQAEIRRLALAVHDARRALKTNRLQLRDIVDDLAPGLIRSARRWTGHRGAGRGELLPFRTVSQRRCVRCALGDLSARGQQWAHGASSAQSRW